MRDGVVLFQSVAKLRQTFVLGNFKSVTFQALQFNANRVVIAIAAATVMRCARMPSAIVAADKLPYFSLALNEEMRRHFEAADALVVRMGIPIELVGEQLMHRLRTVFARWQTDGVNHDQIDLGLRRPSAMVGRWTFFCRLAPPVLPKIEAHA